MFSVVPRGTHGDHEEAVDQEDTRPYNLRKAFRHEARRCGQGHADSHEPDRAHPGLGPHEVLCAAGAREAEGGTEGCTGGDCLGVGMSVENFRRGH
jgi:hypothetical protein